MPKTPSKNKCTSIGGQALIEGIMMRGPAKTSMAVRKPDGSIFLDVTATTMFKDRHKWAGLPIIRGVVAYVESMVFGSKALMRAADIAVEEEPATEKQEAAEPAREEAAGPAFKEETPAPGEVHEEAPSQTAPTSEELPAGPEEPLSAEVQDSASQPEKAAENKASSASKDEENPWWYRLLMAGSMALGILLAIVLFMWLPSQLFNLLNGVLGGGFDRFRALFEGIVKIILFLIYLAAVALMPDIKRIFMYHGAEHKTIFAYEKGLALTVENVRTQRRFHPRCGTSFLVIILAVSILLSTTVSLLFPFLTQNILVWVGVKLLMLPLICGLGYELIKFCGRRQNLLTRILSAPGMWVQRLTTKEPDDSMIEVGIAAMLKVIPDDPEDDCW